MLEKCKFDPSVRTIPWRRAWQPTPVLLPGTPHGNEQRRLTVQGVAKRRNWSDPACEYTSSSTGSMKWKKWKFMAKSCPTPCDPVDHSLPGSSVHEMPQTRITEWVAISFSRGSSQPRDQTCASCLAGIFFTLSQQGSPDW